MNKQAIQLSEHFTRRRLLRFTAPTILMMLFSSVYGVVDGLFVSNYTGKQGFAAVNLIWPFPMLLGAVGYMLGTGGCALVSKTMGEGQIEKTRSYFTMITLVALGLGVLLATFGYLLVDNVAKLLGARDEVLRMGIEYGRWIILALPFFILQCMFQPFMVAAEKPWQGFGIVVMVGVVNVAFDYWLICVRGFGVWGSGLATFLSQIVGAVLPLLLFVYYKPAGLHFGKPVFEWTALRKACTNGISEFVVNASMPLVNLLYVYLLLHTVGEDGVGVYGVIMYVNIVFFGIYNGYSMGSAPIVSFHYGANNMDEVRNVRKISIRLLLLSALALWSVAEIAAWPIARLFAGYDYEFESMVKTAFALYAFSFLLAPFNIYASSFFTALNNGKVSAIISFSRILLFQTGTVLILPLCIGTNGFWLALPVAELLCLIVTVHFFSFCKPKYNY